MTETHLKNVIEAALLAAGKPLQIAELAQLFEEHVRPDNDAVRSALASLASDYEGRGIEIKETATGFRVQVRKELAPEISRLWPERPPRYSRALLETLALIAYRQPITRAEIEAVRGVAVNPNIIKTLLERNWVRVVGHRDVPGRPELLGTTREFLDYFSLRSLDELPPLAELKAMTDPNLPLPLTQPTPAASAAVDGLTDGGVAEAAAATAEEPEPAASPSADEPNVDAAIADDVQPAAAEALDATETAQQVEPELSADTGEPDWRESETSASADDDDAEANSSDAELSDEEAELKLAEDDEDNEDSDGDSAELVAARRDFEP
jgi:segregation and condensation protein B